MIRPATAFSIIAVCAVGYGMFQVKYQVMQLEDQLAHIQRQIAGDREAIHVLNAEWSLLTQPARLAELARRHLNLDPVTNAKLAQLDSLPERPSETPSAAVPAVPAPTAETRGAQVASIKVSAER